MNMDGSDVYSKTPKGIAEISLRSAQLAMATRRVLIMIDGRRSLDELATQLRSDDVGTAITQLESLGLIQRNATSHSLDVPTIAGRETEGLPTSGGSAIDDANAMTLEEAKRRAVRELTDRFGPGAEALALRIESCRTIEDFRERVREAERFVSVSLGPAAAADYLRAVRKR